VSGLTCWSIGSDNPKCLGCQGLRALRSDHLQHPPSHGNASRIPRSRKWYRLQGSIAMYNITVEPYSVLPWSRNKPRYGRGKTIFPFLWMLDCCQQAVDAPILHDKVWIPVKGRQGHHQHSMEPPASLNHSDFSPPLRLCGTLWANGENISWYHVTTLEWICTRTKLVFISTTFDVLVGNWCDRWHPTTCWGFLM